VPAAYFCAVNYQEAIDYLFARLPMFSRTGPAAYRASLDNTLALCMAFDNPQQKFKSVHVAGTNGKGSVSHMLAAILKTAGYKTGLYTSPHLRDFRERIRINGEMVDESFVIEFTKKIQSLVDELDPSFFEVTVVMAFEWFARKKVAIAIIETGLGGRLDSTNVIRPELSVITQVGMDHMNLLGHSLPEIAAEKAGIIKNRIPVVVGEYNEKINQVFDNIAKERNAPLVNASQKRKAINWNWKNGRLYVELAREGKTDHETYELDLPGIYQIKNLVTTLEACSVLHDQGWAITPDHLRYALLHTKELTGLHGRWEMISDAPRVILDVAHNEDGIRQLVRQLEVTDYHELHLVLGFVKDKDIEHLLSLLPGTAHYYFTQASIPRALSYNELAERAGKYGLKGSSFARVKDALQSARSKARHDDLILVCGSVFVVGEVRE
jgi:dihydrofolate synthase/folylpolyglutamate synthase